MFDEPCFQLVNEAFRVKCRGQRYRPVNKINLSVGRRTAYMKNEECFQSIDFFGICGLQFPEKSLIKNALHFSVSYSAAGRSKKWIVEKVGQVNMIVLSIRNYSANWCQKNIPMQLWVRVTSDDWWHSAIKCDSAYDWIKSYRLFMSSTAACMWVRSDNFSTKRGPITYSKCAENQATATHFKAIPVCENCENHLFSLKTLADSNYNAPQRISIHTQTSDRTTYIVHINHGISYRKKLLIKNKTKIQIH